MRKYLFEYQFRGSTWGIIIHANSIAEAKEKMRAAGLAAYKGEGVIRIPVESAWKWPLILVGGPALLWLVSNLFR